MVAENLSRGLDEQFLQEIGQFGTLKLKDDNPMDEIEKLYLIPNPEKPERKIASRKQIASYYYHAYNFRKRLESILEVVKSNEDASSKRLGELQSIEDLTKFTQTMDDGATINFRIVVEDYVTIDIEQRDIAYAFLLAHKMGGLIKPIIHPMSLKSQIGVFLRQDAETDDENIPEETEIQESGEQIIESNIKYWRHLAVLMKQQLESVELPKCFKVYTVIKSKFTRTKK